MRRIILITCLSFSVFPLYSQQDPQFSQHLFNPSQYNPAFYGIENALSATAHVRSQWLGVDGHPTSENINLHAPFPLLHGGLGIQFLNDQQGALRNTSVQLGYSYIIKTRAGEISAGISIGILQANLNGEKLRAPEGNYQNGINHNDFILPSVSVSGYTPVTSAGVFFSGKNLNLGFSSNHLFPEAANFGASGNNLEVNFERHYYFLGRYLVRIMKDISVIPAALLKASESGFQTEVDAIVLYNNFLWLGVGYRGHNKFSNDALIGFAGMKISNALMVGYSYDYSLSPLSSAVSGSHELLLNYKLNLVRELRPGKVIFTPRF